MRILDLHIDGFGKFHDLSVSFDQDLNVVYGKNEAGKSTLHTFIRCMLFGLERGRGRAARGDLYSKYEPWQNKRFRSPEKSRSISGSNGCSGAAVLIFHL